MDRAMGRAAGRAMFVNLPVRDLDRSVAFFRRLGFEFDPRYTDGDAACMVVGAGAYVMLLVERFFAQFTSRPVAGPDAPTEVTLALAVASRAEVDALVGRALAAGATPAQPRADEFPMYGWSFHDLDGHLWELVCWDPAAA
jgi:predicted lactoylglutathione lyase